MGKKSIKFNPFHKDVKDVNKLGHKDIKDMDHVLDVISKHNRGEYIDGNQGVVKPNKVKIRKLTKKEIENAQFEFLKNIFGEVRAKDIKNNPRLNVLESYYNYWKLIVPKEQHFPVVLQNYIYARIIEANPAEYSFSGFKNCVSLYNYSIKKLNKKNLPTEVNNYLIKLANNKKDYTLDGLNNLILKTNKK